MRHDWYLCKYDGDKYIEKSPYAMSKSEAESLRAVSVKMNPNFKWRVVHRRDLCIR